MSEKRKNIPIFKSILCNALLKNHYFIVVLLIIIVSVFFSCKFELDANNQFKKICLNIPKEQITSSDAYMTIDSYFQKYAILYLLHCLTGFVHNYAFSRNSIKLKALVYKYLIEKYMNMSCDDYHRIGSGKIYSFINRQTDAFVNLLEVILIDFLYSLIYLALFLKYILFDRNFKSFQYFKYIYILILTLFTIFIVFHNFISFRLKGRLLLAQHSAYKVLLDILKNYNIVKTFNKDKYEIDKYENSMKLPIVLGLSFFTFDELSKLGFRLLCFFSLAFIFFSRKISAFNISNFKDVLSFIDDFKNLKGKISSINRNISIIICNLTETETCQLYIENSSQNSKKLAVLESYLESLHFNGISIFQDQDLVFCDFNMLVKPGKKVAITGRNGSGKSTIYMALLGLKSYSGSLCIGNVDMCQMDCRSISSFFSYVPQEPHLFNMSVMDNLKYGKIISDEEVIEICMKCKTHNMLKGLKNGYETMVGQDCKNISGGQAQIINFMRAVIKDSPIFLLDEPTSNLDNSTSNLIIDCICNVLEDKTVFMTTHNPSQLEKFDKIINIYDKKITVYNGFAEFSACPLYSHRL